MKDKFETLLQAVIKEENIPFFSVDKQNRSINFLMDDWNVTLNNDGTWEIV